MAFNSAPLALLSDHQMNPNNSDIEYLNLTNTDQNNLTNPHQNLHIRYYQPPQDTDMNHQSYNLSQEHRQLQPWDGNGYPEHYDMNNSGYNPNQADHILKIFKPTTTIVPNPLANLNRTTSAGLNLFRKITKQQSIKAHLISEALLTHWDWRTRIQEQKARDLNAATKQRLENIGLTRLRKEANENVTHHRMTDNIREELDELYYQFQCSINRLSANTGVGLISQHGLHRIDCGQFNKESKAESKGIVQSSVAGQKYTRSVLADWVRKISIDLKSLSFSIKSKGFEYLQLLIGEDNPFGESHIWVGGRGVEDSKANKAKEAQKKTSVGYKNEVVPVHEWDEGNHKPNLKSIRRRLSALMYNASGGEIDKGWPATDTASMLQKYNLKVVIEPNDQAEHRSNTGCASSLGTNKVRMTYSRPPPTTVATKNNTPAPKKRKRHHRTDNTASEEATVTGTAPADTTTATTGNSADSASTLTESGQTSGAQTSHANVTPTGSSAGATGSPPLLLLRLHRVARSVFY
ncbi:hypothetical protein H4Q26_007449 [Puccinia striiformis f. sp. tritici PST-130]|nr:hypothetical protein H4Q26_007449 [Puccinia striiformis f. sp. tritici PST-130]